jgi:hypothetical protein
MSNFKLIETCKHLELIPIEKHKNSVKGFLRGLEYNPIDEDSDSSMLGLTYADYSHYCTEKKGLCIVYERLGLETVDFTSIWINRKKIASCPTRKYDKNSDFEGKVSVETFLLTHIKAD